MRYPTGNVIEIGSAMFQRESPAFSPSDDAPGKPDPSAEEGFLILPGEWEELNDVAMSFHGVMKLIEEHGFDNSTGAEELLRLVYQEYERALSRIRRRIDGEEE